MLEKGLHQYRPAEELAALSFPNSAGSRARNGNRSNLERVRFLVKGCVSQYSYSKPWLESTILI